MCRYASVEDLGSPSDAANKLLDRYLNKEFMSTRIGIRRQGEVLAASSREKDGRLYYDIEVRSSTVVWMLVADCCWLAWSLCAAGG